MNGRTISPDGRLLLLALAIGLLATAENWAFGAASWIYAYGSGLETIPTLLALSYDGRNLSSWAPFVGGGVDRFAFWGNASPFSIEYLLFAHLPTWIANAVHRFAQYTIGTYFTARVLRDLFDQPVAWSAVGGVIFACFSYFTVGQLFTLPAVPLVIWSVERLLRADAGSTALAACGVIFSFLTTFTFGVPYLLLFVGIWLLGRQLIDGRKGLARYAAFCCGLTVPNLLQLAALLTSAAGSHRAGWSLELPTFSIGGLFYSQLQYDLFNQDKVLSVLTQVLPWSVFIVGTGGAILALYRWPEHRALAREFLRVAGFWFLFAQKWLWLFIQLAVAQVFPWVAGVYMGRFFEIPATFLIAIGMTLFLRMGSLLIGGWIARAAIGAIVTALAIFMLIRPKVFLFEALAIGDWGQANYNVSALDDLRRQTNGPFRVASVLPLQPAYAYAHGLEAADGWANIYSQRYRELWLKILEPLFDELPATRKIFGADSGRAEDNFIFLGAGLIAADVGRLPGEDPKQALREGFDIDRRFRLNLLELLNVRFLLSEYPLKSKGLRLVHAPAVWPTWPIERDRNTGLVNSELPPLPAEIRNARLWDRFIYQLTEANKRKAKGKDLFVYELPNALARARLVANVNVAANAEAVLKVLETLDGDALKSTAVIESSDAAPLENRTTFTPRDVRITTYEPSRIVIRASDGPPAFLVVGNTWNAYWRCTVNGRPRSVIRVNHAQIGVRLEESETDVVLEYSPPYVALFDRLRKVHSGR